MNAPVAGYEADFLWPRHRLVVETDGAAAHLTATAFEHDRRRDTGLQLAGYRVFHLTWRQVVAEPAWVSGTLRRLLGGEMRDAARRLDLLPSSPQLAPTATPEQDDGEAGRRRAAS